MPQPLAYQYWILATLEQHGGMEVPEAMQLDGVSLDTLRGTTQRPRKGHRIEDLPNVIGKNEVLIFVRSPED